MLEVLGAIAVGTMLLIGMTEMIDTSLEDVRGQSAAQQQSLILNATRKYLTANYSALVSASATAIVPVSVAQLKAANFLSSSFAAVNSYGQSTCVLVRQPNLGKLDVLVATYGGQAIPDKSIATAAMSAGQGAGYIAGASPGTALGASWNLVTTPYRSVSCGGGASVLTGGAADGGHLVSNLFYDGPGQLSTDFLYRDAVPGRPELNQINVPLAMANAALVTAGSACGTQPALALEQTTRGIMVCAADGTWKNTSYWKDPVANFASLPAAGNQVGDVRVISNLGRAFTYTGSAWQALAIDQNGDMTIPRDMTTGRFADVGNNLRVYSNLTVEGRSDFMGYTAHWGDIDALSGFTVSGGMVYFGADAPLNADGPVAVHNGMSIESGLTLYGNLTGDGLVQGNRLQAAAVAAAGARCTLQGVIAQSISGVPVVCRNVGGVLEYRYANGNLTP